MKKVTAICLHENYSKVKNFTAVKANGDLVTLIHHNNIELAYGYNCFQDMYRDLLSILKQNGFYVKHWSAFGLDWYSINFIDIANPNLPKVFAFTEK